MLKRLLLPVIALTLALAPALTSHAAIGPHTVVIGGLTFPTNTNGCAGPVVGVYGSSAMKGFILSTATAYCNDATNNPNHVDVEYLSGGDSCPGVVFAAGTAASATADPLGASDVFQGPCAATLASGTSDNKVAVNLVDLLMQCPGANTPQGGAPASEIPLASQTPCNGSGSGATLNFPAPNNLSVPSAGLVLKNTASNWSQVGGQNVTAQAQQRITGSGTRITECYNVFGPGADASCLNNTAAGAAATSGVMENDICGPTGGSPVDPVGAIGYSGRGTILQSAQTGAPANTPTSNCGIVNQGGSSGWNGTCDAAQTPNNTPGAILRSGSIFICPGDNDVANGNYVVWGYAHFDTGSGEVSTNPSSLYVAWINAHALNITSPGAGTITERQQGFLNICQMNVSRGFDAGPYSLATSSC